MMIYGKTRELRSLPTIVAVLKYRELITHGNFASSNIQQILSSDNDNEMVPYGKTRQLYHFKASCVRRQFTYAEARTHDEANVAVRYALKCRRAVVLSGDRNPADVAPDRHGAVLFSRVAFFSSRAGWHPKHVHL